MRSWLFAPAVFALTIVPRAACSEESKVQISDVPKAGVAAVKAMFPDAEITGAAKETEDDKTVFEITLKQKGRTIDVTVGIDGNIQVVEKEIAENDLPAPVKRALETKYPKAAYKIVEQVEAVKNGKRTLDFYEVLLVTANHEKIEVQIAPDGKIKAEEKKQGEKD